MHHQQDMVNNRYGLVQCLQPLKYSRSQLLALRSKAIKQIPFDAYCALKDNGLLHVRGRRGGAHMHKSNHVQVQNVKSKLSSDDQVTTTCRNELDVRHCNVHSARNKTCYVADYAIEHNVDVLFLTETWLREDDNVIIGELKPPGYSFLNVPRSSDKDRDSF